MTHVSGLPGRAERVHLGDGLHGGCGASRDEGLPVGWQGVGVGHVKQGDPVLVVGDMKRHSTDIIRMRREDFHLTRIANRTRTAPLAKPTLLLSDSPAVLVEVAVLLDSCTNLGCNSCLASRAGGRLGFTFHGLPSSRGFVKKAAPRKWPNLKAANVFSTSKDPIIFAGKILQGLTHLPLFTLGHRF